MPQRRQKFPVRAEDPFIRLPGTCDPLIRIAETACASSRYVTSASNHRRSRSWVISVCRRRSRLRSREEICAWVANRRLWKQAFE
jgi:hypothetical protein